MRYEVIDTSGQVVFWTEHIECVPSSDQLDAMTSAGYRHKVDGKIVAKSKVIEAVGADKPAASVVSDTQKIVHNKPAGSRMNLF